MSLVAIGFACLAACGGLYWFLHAEETIDGVSPMAEQGATVERDARRRSPEGSPRRVETEGTDNSADIGSTAFSSDRSEADASSTKRTVLSCRLEGVDPSTLPSWSICVEGRQPGRRRTSTSSLSMTKMAADGSAAEVDLSNFFSSGYRTLAHLDLVIAYETAVVQIIPFDEKKFIRRELPDRIVYDILVDLGDVSLVTGRIAVAEGEALDRRLFVFLLTDGRPRRDPSETAGTDDDGRFLIALDRDREWLIACLALPYSPITMRVPRRAQPIFDLGSKSVTRGESISGVVTRLGLPASVMHVEANLSSRMSADDADLDLGGVQAKYRDGKVLLGYCSSTTSADGTYSIPRLEREAYEVKVFAEFDGKVEVHDALIQNLQKSITAPAAGVDFEVYGVRLEVRVVGDDGPIDDWFISIKPPTGPSWEASSNDDSSSRLVYVPADVELEIVVTSEGYETSRVTVKLERLRATALHELKLRRIAPSSFSVRVVDAPDLDIRRLAARLERSDADADLPETLMKARKVARALVDARFVADRGTDGSFVFEGVALPKGRHRFMIEPEDTEVRDRVIPAPMDIEIDPDRRAVAAVSFERGGSLRVGAKDSSGAFVAGKAIVRDGAGRDLHVRFTESFGRTTPIEKYLAPGTDGLSESGMARTMKPLRPGPYVLEFESIEGEKKSVPFSISAGETTEVVVVF